MFKTALLSFDTRGLPLLKAIFREQERRLDISLKEVLQ